MKLKPCKMVVEFGLETEEDVLRAANLVRMSSESSAEEEAEEFMGSTRGEEAGLDLYQLEQENPWLEDLLRVFSLDEVNVQIWYHGSLVFPGDLEKQPKLALVNKCTLRFSAVAE